MQDTMVYEQEQLLFAIDDIDDATIMAESAVIHQIADLWLKTSMIQESMSPEQFEKYYQEANTAERIGGKMDDFAAKVKDKIKNFSFKEMLGKIWGAIKRVWTVIWGKFKKFIAHFKPSYISHLIRTKNSLLAKVAKEYGCKVKAETDGSITLMLPFLDISFFTNWIRRNQSAVDRMIKDIEKAISGDRKITKMRKLKYFDENDFLGSKLEEKLEEFQSRYGSALGTEGQSETRINAQMARDMTKLFPTKMMSVEEFEDKTLTGSGKTKTISGKPKEFQNLSQYMAEFSQKVDKLCDLARQFDGKVQGNADSDADLKAFATSLVAESNKFLANVNNAQEIMIIAVGVSRGLCNAIAKAVEDYDASAYDKKVEKLQKTGDAEATTSFGRREQEVQNRLKSSYNPELD